MLFRQILNNPTLHLKELEKEEQTKLKHNSKEEIINIRAEITEKDTKTVAKINETYWFFEKTKLTNLLHSNLLRKRGARLIKSEMKKKLKLK